jgi:hypothetical protein
MIRFLKLALRLGPLLLFLSCGENALFKSQSDVGNSGLSDSQRNSQPIQTDGSVAQQVDIGVKSENRDTLGGIATNSNAVEGKLSKKDKSLQEAGLSQNGSDGGIADASENESAGGTGDESQLAGGAAVETESRTGCWATHVSTESETHVRVEGSGDCIKCPSASEVIRFSYTSSAGQKDLIFNGAETNGPGAGDSGWDGELILEQTDGICWSENFANEFPDTPSASAFCENGSAGILEFDKGRLLGNGPDGSGPTGTLSYYKNDSLVWELKISDAVPQPFGEDGPALNCAN